MTELLEPEITDKTKRNKKGKKITAAIAAGFLFLSLSVGSTTIGFGLGANLSEYFFDAFSNEAAEINARQEFSFDSAPVSMLPKAAPPDAERMALAVGEVSLSVVSINVAMRSTNIFNITSETPGAGSGIIFSDNGDRIYIATNNHVVENAARVNVSFNDDVDLSARFVGGDPESDLAVLYVDKKALDKTGAPYKTAVFGSSAQMRTGDEVAAIGNAMGEGKAATFGIISAVGKTIHINGRDLEVLQTDSAINSGNSGGPLIDINGRVVGINTAKIAYADVEGMGFSIPSDTAKRIFDELIQNGVVKRPYIGVDGSDVSERMKSIYNLPSVGVIIRKVYPDAGAEAAGAMVNDLIVSFNEQSVKNTAELDALISACKPGDTARVEIYRNGELISIEIEIKDYNLYKE